MNLSNLNNLISILSNAIKTREGLDYKGQKVGFNMVTFFDDDVSDNLDNCDTVACLAGWAAIVAKEDPRDAGIETLANFLDISLRDARQLAYALTPKNQDNTFGPPHMNSITPEEALRVLEHLRDYEEVDWSIIGKDPTDDQTFNGPGIEGGVNYRTDPEKLR